MGNGTALPRVFARRFDFSWECDAASMGDTIQSTKSRSISSRVLPLVSGSRNLTKTNPAAQIAPYSQNDPAGPRVAFRIGNVYVREKARYAICDETATAMAAPRLRLGKISEMITHVTGASETA